MENDDDCWHDYREMVTCVECEGLLGEFCLDCGADTSPEYLVDEIGGHAPGCGRARGGQCLTGPKNNVKIP